VKTLQLSVIVGLLLGSLFCGNSVYAPCAKGIQCGDLRPLPSPLDQFKEGYEAKNVLCHDGFVLVIKSEDNSFACVKPQTAQKLVERGWGTIYHISSNMTRTKGVVEGEFLHRTIDGRQYNFFPSGIGGIANVSGYTDPSCKNGYGSFTIKGFIGYTEYSSPNVQVRNYVTSQNTTEVNDTLVLVIGNGNVIVFYCVTESNIQAVP
jgi:hypothetical protein